MQAKGIVGRRAGTLKAKRRESGLGWFFCSPYLLYTLILFLLPLIWAVWLATMDWNLISADKTFVGIGNFTNLFSDKGMLNAFLNAFKYLFLIVVFSSVFGITIALLVDKVPSRIQGITSVLFFVPYLTSGVATSVVVKYFFAYNSFFNTFLREKLNLNIGWFTNDTAAFWVIVIIIVWKLSGYYALFYLASIKNIPIEVKEAARLDGASWWTNLTRITLPMILPTINTVVALATGLSFRIYTEPYLLTAGSPGTTTWLVEIYHITFTKFKSGYGTAMSLLFAVQMFLVLRLINSGMNKLMEKFGY